MSYPQFAKIDGKEYKINTDYETALACFDVIWDETYTEEDRALGIIGLLFEDYENIQNNEEALNKAKIYLTCGKEESSDGKIDMDFEQDKDYIEASFMSDYGIDLDNSNMHWWKYMSRLNGLTDKCILNRVRDIRNYDLSTIKDNKSKNEIIKAKERVGLKTKLTVEEQEQLDEFESLLN